MTDVLQVSTTTDNKEAAYRLAESAVKASLAASAQVFGPAASFFWHKNEFGTGEEWQVFLRTTADRYKQLEEHLVEQHEWSSPEVTATSLSHGLGSYVDWVHRTTS